MQKREREAEGGGGGLPPMPEDIYLAEAEPGTRGQVEQGISQPTTTSNQAVEQAGKKKHEQRRPGEEKKKPPPGQAIQSALVSALEVDYQGLVIQGEDTREAESDKEIREPGRAPNDRMDDQAGPVQFFTQNFPFQIPQARP